MPPAYGARTRQASERHASTGADVLLVHPCFIIGSPFHKFRYAEIEDPIGLPQAVMTHVSQAARPVGVPSAIDGKRVARVIRAIRLGALPQGPVEAVRHWWPGLVVL